MYRGVEDNCICKHTSVQVLADKYRLRHVLLILMQLNDLNVQLSDTRIFLKESIKIRDDASDVKDKCANELKI